ncbi:MAG: hypothetical protein COA79_08110 [Planctomycetota bacterium]|nr:MAG: hypothetical protein COA79_08110 [Planctomycetota bacterium]
MRSTILLLSLFFFSVAFGDVKRETKVKKSGIEEKLGEMIDLASISFFDEEGNKKTLKEYADGKPIALALAFYRCTSICMPFLNGVSEYVDGRKGTFKPGEEFKLLTISFDPEEDHVLAKEKKANQFAAMKNSVPENSWRFLTGDKESISVLTEKVGFHYVKMGEGDYRHQSALIFLSPKGKVVRYIPSNNREGRDTYFNPFYVDMAVAESYKGNPGPAYVRFLNTCFKFEPANKQYTLKVLQIMGALITLCGIFLFLTVTVLSKKKKPDEIIFKDEGSDE